MAQDDRRETEASRNKWISFPGGELEGQPPKALCPACRDAVHRAAAAERPVIGGSVSRERGAVGDLPQSKQHAARTLCFQCYRADLERNRSLRAAGQLNTASPERFQGQLPFQAVDASRLQMLKADRAQARVLAATGPGVIAGIAGIAARRRRAQISARHALQSVTGGCGDRQSRPLQLPDRARAVAAAIHAAELQLPESWLPFVVAR